MKETPRFLDRQGEHLGASLIDKLLADLPPRYLDCPRTINLLSHHLGDILVRFTRDADRQMVDLMKAVKCPSNILATIAPTKQQVAELWWTEFYQSIYLVEDNQWYVNEVRQGGIGTSSINTKKIGEPRNDKRKVFIHTHPADNTFSTPDLLQFFLAKDADKVLGYDSAILYSGLTVQFVVTDHHIYMSFPTADTTVPDYSQAWATSLIPADMMADILPAEYQKTWKGLIDTYGENAIDQFRGSTLYQASSFFPDEVSEEGAALINLAHTLKVCQQYSLALYVAPRKLLQFHRVDSVADVYPQILPSHTNNL